MRLPFSSSRSRIQGYNSIPALGDGESLAPSEHQSGRDVDSHRRARTKTLLATTFVLIGSVFLLLLALDNGVGVGRSMPVSAVRSENYPIERKIKKKKSKSSSSSSSSSDNEISQGTKSGKVIESGNENVPPIAQRRCEWVVNMFNEKDAGKSDAQLREEYAVQSVDSNVFYRATANIFWVDFVENGWGDLVQFENIGINPVHADGTPLQPKSTWTWITGDQHLSNFGAWRNRHRDVVFSVNDFDEAAVYDFQVDVLRIAVSVCSHAYTNGLKKVEIDNVLRAFTDTYVETLIGYVGGDKELLYELTPETASGQLQSYLDTLRDDKSTAEQLEKFTELNGDGERQFIHNDKTRLVAVDDATLQKIRDQFTADNFGSTMMKVGWHVRNWDDDFFEVLDVAARLGSGVGSYGVDRYYILLRGTDDSLEDGTDGNAVILDVKYEPPGAVTRILSEADAAWYNTMFINDAHRAVEAQRRLTSYVDPFTGWVVLDGKPFVVRQRSPWKGSFDLSTLTASDDFIDFMEQTAVATATSHARGTLSKSPGQFKHVISSALRHWADRVAWGDAISDVAHEYREQVLQDFQCFKEFVEANYA